MSGRLLLLVLSLTALGRAEIVDRVAATAGNRVIATSDILREIRLSAFMNHAQPDFSPQARREVASRLLERALIDSEMELGRYSAPQAAESEPGLAAIKKERFPTVDVYVAALSAYGISEEDLRVYLLQQLAVVRFVDARFGPAVQVLETDMRDYYTEHFVKELGNRAPAFEEVRQEIEAALRAQRANELLDEWLKETKARTRIEFKPEAFQ
jgi:hypothetical protein